MKKLFACLFVPIGIGTLLLAKYGILNVDPAKAESPLTFFGMLLAAAMPFLFGLWIKERQPNRDFTALMSCNMVAFIYELFTKFSEDVSMHNGQWPANLAMFIGFHYIAAGILWAAYLIRLDKRARYVPVDNDEIFDANRAY